ncbi:hypothetical protein [Brachybacterium paraconglomeratum]|uniref:hypothetical protein n=1 Tax=Brachybacterium paraconglomeratum TaxID=173362 RepID=UPI0022AE7FEA|nr:hypothetical protein [Brachybacterium paraconglomeratum]MCZ4327037.1 hypothetical protein [Brachybacterium paraconglomeratum]
MAADAKFPWLLDDVEPLADALLVGVDTDRGVLVDAALGEFAPTGKLPITFPDDAGATAVDEDWRCASRNDVHGYAKEQHMDGRAYVHVDTDGNRCQLGHGLSW